MERYDMIPMNWQTALRLCPYPAAVVAKIRRQPAIIIKAPDSKCWRENNVNITLKPNRTRLEAGTFIQFDVEVTDNMQSLFAMNTFVDPARDSQLLELLAGAEHHDFFIFDDNMHPTFTLRVPVQDELREQLIGVL